MLFKTSISTRFNRINSDRSIPTLQPAPVFRFPRFPVSIVSIQTDQSRLMNKNMLGKQVIMFQSYQSKQIKPDDGSLETIKSSGVTRFQSYQSKQINPDCIRARNESESCMGVSIVSIQTDQSRLSIPSLLK